MLNGPFKVKIIRMSRKYMWYTENSVWISFKPSIHDTQNDIVATKRLVIKIIFSWPATSVIKAKYYSKVTEL